MRERVSSEREWQPTKLNVDKQRWARAHRSTAHRTPDVWDLISHGFITDQIHTANSSSLSLSLSSKLDMILRTVETQINDKLQIQFPLAISTFLFFMVPTGGFSLVQRHFCINITQYHQLIQFHKNVCAFFLTLKLQLLDTGAISVQAIWKKLVPEHEILCQLIVPCRNHDGKSTSLCKLKYSLKYWLVETK